MSKKDVVRFSPQDIGIFEARYQAQKIAFGPIVFQCVRYALKRGILKEISLAGDAGVSLERLSERGGWDLYVLKVVLESCMSAGCLRMEEGRYVLEKTGYCFVADKMTQINFDFVNDVCYQGMFNLEDSLDSQMPVGLKNLGDWPTLYEGLSTMPEPARSSWLSFDHYYSDVSFDSIIPAVMGFKPRQLMDIGANTGKFACALLNASSDVQVNLVDLPQQLNMARGKLEEAGLSERAHFHPRNLLDHSETLPEGQDLIWMSQFLSCFSEANIQSILNRVCAALNDGGQVFIMDTFWDRQRHEIARFCLINTSPYFTSMASGNSKIYKASDYIELASKVGLRVVDIQDDIGYCHSLIRFTKC